MPKTKMNPWERVSGMEDDVNAARDLTRVLFLIAEGMEMRADGAALSRIAQDLGDRIDRISEARDALFHDLHPNKLADQ